MPDEFGNPLPGEEGWVGWVDLAGRRERHTGVYLDDTLRRMLEEWTVYRTVTQPPQTAPKPPKAEPEEYVKVANSFLVGCDPEMILVKDGQIVNVSGKMGPFGEVGYDHGGDVVELRPQPAKSTFTLTKRLHKLLKENPSLIQFESEKWRAGAFFESGGGLGVEAAPGARGNLGGNPIPTPTTPRPARSRVSLGGHVHLDIKPQTPGNWYYDNDYVPALDRVTRYFEHLDLLPQKECLERRTRGGYGQYADYRTEHSRLEYRTMASWLFSPKTTFLCLTGAKLAAVDPQFTLDTLKLKDISYKNLTGFYEAFAPKDTDAKRVCEEILEKGLKSLQANPDQDVKGAWQ